MDYLARLLIVLHFYETSVEGRFVDSTVKLTSNMNLECIYPKTANITQMSWVKSIATDKETIAVFHPRYGVHIQDQYKDRVRFINASSKGKSLNFIKTTEADMGFYFCSITFADGIWEKVIQVIPSATLDHHWHVLLVAGGASATLLLLVTILIITITLVYCRKKKRRRIMKALSKTLQSTQTRPSNSYGRSNFHGTPNVRRGEASISGQSDEIYVNYRDFSRKPKTRA